MLSTAIRASTRLAPRAAIRLSAPSFVQRYGVRFYSNELNKAGPAATYGASPKVFYTEEHEWLAVHEDGTSFVGITKYAADALGDATYIELAEVDAEVEKGESIGSVESVKSASELYSPISGTVSAVNEALSEKPGLVNEDPLGEGWFTQIKISDPAETDDLMDLTAYEEFIKSD